MRQTVVHRTRHAAEKTSPWNSWYPWAAAGSPAAAISTIAAAQRVPAPARIFRISIVTETRCARRLPRKTDGRCLLKGTWVPR